MAPDGPRAGVLSGKFRASLTPAADLTPMPPDDGPAVVKRSDVSDQWIERTFRYAREHGLPE